MRRFLFILWAAAVGSGMAVGDVHAGSRQYEVTVTNVTRGQSFTPILVTTHKQGVRVFEPGAPASAQLAALAEAGDTGPLGAMLEASGDVAELSTSEGLLGPGQSVTVNIGGRGAARWVSLAAMLIPTNDTFFGVNGVALPRRRGAEVVYWAVAYDAGSEPNDELCSHIPGPVCGGEAASEGGGEGYVHVHPGMHGIGDLSAATYDWRNPVASIAIQRVR